MTLFPVSSLYSAMFEDVFEDGDNEPAAKKLYEGSYEGQNASAEIIPTTREISSRSLAHGTDL